MHAGDAQTITSGNAAPLPGLGVEGARVVVDGRPGFVWLATKKNNIGVVCDDFQAPASAWSWAGFPPDAFNRIAQPEHRLPATAVLTVAHGLELRGLSPDYRYSTVPIPPFNFFCDTNNAVF